MVPVAKFRQEAMITIDALIVVSIFGQW